MERLTERNKNGLAITKSLDFHPLINKLAKYEDLEEQCIKETTWGFKELLCKWKVFFDDITTWLEYKNAEEQGLLLRLPCKVGDKVWAITTYSLDAYAYEVPLKYPQEKKIQSITVTSGDVLYHVKNRTYSVCNFGKTVFLTKEEAEQALKKMGE